MPDPLFDEFRREWWLRRAEAKSEGKPWPRQDYSEWTNFSMWVILSFWGVIIAAATVIILNKVYKWVISNDWQMLSQTFSTTKGAILTSLTILMLAFAFFRLREKRPFVYGSMEIGAAAITLYDICKHITDKGLDGPHWLLALLGALYIAVRGFDNINRSLKAPQNFSSVKKRNNI